MFSTHLGAGAAVQALHAAACDMKLLSVVGKGYHRADPVAGDDNPKDRTKYWGNADAFWGGIWGLLPGSAVFMSPGTGALLAAGPVAGWIVGAHEGAVGVGGVSPVAAWLMSIGIPMDGIVTCEMSLKAGRFMLVVNGTREEVSRARTLLGETGAAGMQAFLVDSDLGVHRGSATIRRVSRTAE